MGVGSGGDHVNREYCYQLITISTFLTIQTERYCSLNEERQIRGMQPGIYMMTSSL